MSQTASHAQVSLHPLASRHGAVSSTLVPVSLRGAEAESPRDGAAHHTQDRFAFSHEDHSTPRLHPSSPAYTASRRRSPSPKSLPLPAQSREPPSYGIQHVDLDDYPIISDEPLPSNSTSDDESPDEYDSIVASVDDRSSNRSSQHLSKQSLAAPIRAMSAAQLAALHEQYVSLDVPHHVVFPFLHGVDGSIVAQNAFFGAPLSGQPTPAYRGLTIVRADMPTALEMERMQASRNAYASNHSRARTRTFSSVTTHSSGSSPDTDDGFESSWNGLKAPDPFVADSELASTAASTASASASTASTVSSQTSRPSLFSVASGSFSAGSRTSVSTESSIVDDGSRASAKGLRSISPTPVEPQPRHSILNSTVFPTEILRPPSVRRTVYGSTFYSGLSESGSWGDEEEAAKIRRIGPTFVEPSQASGVSLRNFRIQCAKYATISDIVIYCPYGYHSGALTLAKWIREAQATKRRERLLRGWGGLQYNVFVVTDAFDVFEQRFTSLVSVDSHGYDRNRVDFTDREREEMERMTRASEIHDNVWLGSTADAPGALKKSGYGDDSDPPTPDEQANPQCFSVCINCEEDRQPTSSACTPETLFDTAQYLDSIDASMRLEDDTDKMLGSLSRDALLRLDESALCDAAYDGFRNADSRDGSLVLGPNGWTPKPRSVPVRTDASASHFVRTRAADIARGADAYANDSNRRGVLHLDAASVVHLDYQTVSAAESRANGSHQKLAKKLVDLCMWIQQQAMPPASSSPASRELPAFNSVSSTLRTFRDGTRSPTRSFSPIHSRDRTSHLRADRQPAASRRPRRVLLHCPDGYTETSVLALSYLMFARELSLPNAYLDLQLRANRSFFVYPADIAVLEAVDLLLQQMRAARSRATREDRNDAALARRSRHAASKSFSGASGEGHHAEIRRMSLSAHLGRNTQGGPAKNANGLVHGVDFAAEGVRTSFAMAPSSELAGGICRTSTPTPQKCRGGVDTDLVENHAWFDKTRFDGSFPSRILPFLYLGNLDHASNVDMLRVLGITHLVSVGETALAPPDHISAKVNPPLKEHGRTRYQRASAKAAMAEDPSTVPSLNYTSQGITVLNVRNVSDDGIDSLRGTMREAVQFIEAARLSGGKVLVHCRVGVSRSTTIVLAYVMAHLDLGLVESYLLVRSRRLNIVIQPHLLFLWELRGWETFLFRAKQAQISLVRGQQGSPDLRRSSDSREASNALGALSLRSGSGSDQGSGSYKSARSSPSSSPRATYPLTTAVQELEVANPKDGVLEHHLPGVEIGAGAGSIHGFDMAHSATMPFGSGSPSGLSYQASRLTWGYFAREITALNMRYLIV